MRTSPEHETARVYVTVLGDEKTREEALAGLRSAASFLQAEIRKAVRMRRTPRLRFLYDDSIDRGFRVDAALREISTEHVNGNAGPRLSDGDSAADAADEEHDE